MKEAREISKKIKAQQFQPIYFFHGEETFYIDKLVDFIEANALDEMDRSFNQVVLYGRDVTVGQIIENAKRFPMMAERQVVIVKEAQELSKSLNELVEYAKNPLESTILVIAHKYKLYDKRTALYKVLNEKGWVLESQPIKENKLPEFIAEQVQFKGLQIDHKATMMLAEFIGTNLNMIHNAVDKLGILMPKGAVIQPDDIEKNIGFSKEYNSFELTNALTTYDRNKAYKIAMYYADHKKTHPFVVVSASLYSFFSKVMMYHGLRDKSQAAKILGVSPYAVKNYEEGAKKYPMKKISRILEMLRICDGKSKGLGGGAVQDADLYKDLLFTIFSN